MPISAGYAVWTPGANGVLTNSTTAGTTQATGSTFVVVTTLKGYTTDLPSSVPTDTFGNVYSLAQSITVVGAVTQAIYYCINGAGGSAHSATASWTGTGNLNSIAFAEFKGVGAGSVGSAPTGTSANYVLTLAAPSVTTTVAGQLLINCFGSYSSNTQTITDDTGAGIGSGFSIVCSQTNGSYANGAISYSVQAATGSYYDTFTLTANDYVGALALSIVPGAVTAAPQPHLPIMGVGAIAPLAWVIRRRRKLARENLRRQWKKSSGGILIPSKVVA